jgi:hypothetical protein
MLCIPAQQPLYSLSRKHQSLFSTTSGVRTGDLSFVIPSFLNVTVLHYNVFTKAVQSNQQMALSRLMYSMHCVSTIFPYQALERRSAQETVIGCAGLHNIKFEGIEHSLCIQT